MCDGKLEKSRPKYRKQHKILTEDVFDQRKLENLEIIRYIDDNSMEKLKVVSNAKRNSFVPSKNAWGDKVVKAHAEFYHDLAFLGKNIQRSEIALNRYTKNTSITVEFPGLTSYTGLDEAKFTIDGKILKLIETDERSKSYLLDIRHTFESKILKAVIKRESRNMKDLNNMTEDISLLSNGVLLKLHEVENKRKETKKLIKSTRKNAKKFRWECFDIMVGRSKKKKLEKSKIPTENYHDRHPPYNFRPLQSLASIPELKENANFAHELRKHLEDDSRYVKMAHFLINNLKYKNFFIKVS